MNRILVWDLPTRAFHWMLTIAVLGAYAIAEAADDDSPLFQIHMLLGLLAAFLVILRVIWGFVGTRYARFRSFIVGPRALFSYLWGAFRRSGERYVGHNPGSAYATCAMLILSLGLAASGAFLPTSKALDDAHEIMAHLMILVVVVHVVGLAWHTIRYRENIALSMVDGKKLGEASRAIASPRPLAGVVFLALAVGWGLLVFKGHDAQRRQLTLFGQTIRLGEVKHHEAKEGRRNGHHRKNRHRSRYHHDHEGHHHRDRGDRHER